ncbi:MAG: hypothetical protein LRZ85_09750 [Alphaproteobacteria bacterium]|nr:hypothetical protein [Alphaproteobacteria bacterium]MCD8570868.1 hypothetical protein [Alphaproteobacteria bacterium]
MFNFDNFERKFSPGQLYIHDGAWIASIVLVTFLMLFNDVAWSVAGMNLIYIILGAHILTQHQNLYGNTDIWIKRLLMFGAWVVSIFLVAVMPVVALINYGICARDIKKRFSNKEYKTAWTAYMRILGLTVFALAIYGFKVFAVAQGSGAGVE